MAGIDEDGGCRRKCYRVVRKLKEDVWCPGSKPAITSHHLQVLYYLGYCFVHLNCVQPTFLVVNDCIKYSIKKVVHLLKKTKKTSTSVTH